KGIPLGIPLLIGPALTYVQPGANLVIILGF
ncbi:unnamed protein product, partial [marine sediment metagenome]